ncbi:unnamed protein product [Didymodactylos carnosus]|uniref:Uncharacterized protein n=1 Tax=Didymodactylos carnosus TaxID=1234261 RepID=A0A814QMF2_9BILA|nr:unnamed protein product [Didymodactylos carnosus]CAF3883990.1 unnamed protein product [Didymodactylos carnosus]
MVSSNPQPTKWTNTNIEQQNHKQGQNLETFVLLWLDQNVNKSKDSLETQTQLRRSINCLLTFESGNECEEHIGESKDEKIVLIVSGRLGREIVPSVHDLPQLSAIYVYCMDKITNERWAKSYNKHLYQPSSSSRTTASTEVAHRKFIVKTLNLWYKRNKHLLKVDDPQVNCKKAHVLPLTNIKVYELAGEDVLKIQSIHPVPPLLRTESVFELFHYDCIQINFINLKRNSYLYRKGRRYFNSYVKSSSQNILDILDIDPKAQSAFVYLQLFNYMFKAYVDNNRNILNRLYYAWIVIFVYRFWWLWLKLYLIKEKLSRSKKYEYFITKAAQYSIELNSFLFIVYYFNSVRP